MPTSFDASKFKILVTGGKGMFASDFVRVASLEGYTVIPLGHPELDVTDAKQVQKIFETLRPNFVIHTVGLAVDFCQLHPEEGHRVQVWGTEVVARECQKLKATFVNLSTCGLFGDEVRFYSETDSPVLKTEYARLKFLAEAKATAHCERTYNVRPGWLYGGTVTHKKNFVWQRYLEAKSNRVLKSAGDKFGSPTNTEDLSRKILELIQTKQYGLYHVTHSGGASRFEYVQAIVKAFGLNTMVEKVDSSFYQRPSPVPNCEMLQNDRLKFLGLERLPPWEEAIERYVRGLL